MKKIFAGLLVLVVILSLCACTNGAVNARKLVPIEDKVSIPEAETLVEIEDNTSIPDAETLSDIEFVNVEESQFWKERLDVLTAPNGNTFNLSTGWMITQYQGRCLVLMKSGRELWLCDQETGFTKLSGEQLVVDYTVAYDRIYWFNLDREVWVVDWHESSEAKLFCEDAIAVSPHIDEAQGAVVTWDRANWDYGYGLPIYSPYGE